MGGKQNGGQGEKMGYIYSSSSNFLVELVLLVNDHNTARNCSSRTTRHLMNEQPLHEVYYSR
jgi:hypothetical protein